MHKRRSEDWALESGCYFLKNLYNLSDLSLEEILLILQEAEAFRHGATFEGAAGKIVANLFFEPSTRTHYSFQTAQLRLNCKILDFMPETSSMRKGETFYDTVKTFESFGIDLAIIRHSQNEYYNQLEKLNIPFINAGDGTGNHPTQSLLDLMTIRQEFGHFDGLRVAIVGDIRHSRVAHTNIGIMQRLGMEVYTSGPEQLRDANDNYIDFDKAVRTMDVIMLLRVQHERHSERTQMYELSPQEYNRLYGMNHERLEMMKPGAIIMHPAPFNRGVELSDEVVECPQSRIFKQVQNGVFVRMAAIKRALGGF